MSVRRATMSDAAAVAALERECLGADAWSSQLVAHTVAAAEDGRGLVVLAESPAQEPAGFAIAGQAGDVAELHRIAVLPSRRRAGTGRALLEAVLAWGRRTPADRLLLEVRADNAGALGFYADAGFTEVARRRRYYTDGTDAVVLRLPLRGGCGARSRVQA